jgi:hypothetical protein
MASSSKKRTTMAKIARENKLRERRLDKQAKKDARRQAAADPNGGEAAYEWLADPADPDGSAEQSPAADPDAENTPA